MVGLSPDLLSSLKQRQNLVPELPVATTYPAAALHAMELFAVVSIAGKA